MGAKNKVISGDYEGKDVVCSLGSITIYPTHKLKDCVEITKQTVSEYEVLDGSEKISGASAVGRAALGSLLLGPIGLAAGLSAKKKGTYIVAVQFKDGKRSLLEIDQKAYKTLMKVLF